MCVGCLVMLPACFASVDRFCWLLCYFCFLSSPGVYLLAPAWAVLPFHVGPMSTTDLIQAFSLTLTSPPLSLRWPSWVAARQGVRAAMGVRPQLSCPRSGARRRPWRSCAAHCR